MEKIQEHDTLLALVIRSNEWKPGLNFVSSNEDFIQVGTWKYNTDQKLYPHKHLEVKREVLFTQEVLFIKKGKIQANFYSVENDKLVASHELNVGDILVCLKGGHGYQILEDGTEVLEVKNGPYVGPERDRERIPE